MKVALVHDWLTGMRGGEKCLEVLCRAFPDAELFTLLHRRGKLSPAIERMRITTSFLQHIPGATRHYRYLLPLMPRAIESFVIPSDVDLVISLSHAVAKGIRPPPGVPHVCYCFTPMRYAWHLRQDYFGPRLYSPERESTVAEERVGPLALARNMLLNRIRDWDRETSSRVTHFVAISSTIAQRIAECYQRTSTVIHPPVDTEYFTRIDMPREDFYLCVSALVPYKRIDLAIATCNQLGKPLVVIGAGPDQTRLARMAGPTVRMLGWQPDDVIRDYLRRCKGLLFPGHEDFGIVPLEAQACGTPVVAFGKGGTTETLIEATDQKTGTACFFMEQTIDSMAEKMNWLEEHPGQFSSDFARRQALRFSTERFEQELLKFLYDAPRLAAA